MKICFMQHTTFCFFFIFVLKMYLTFVKAIFYTAIVEHFYRQRSATKLSKRSSLLCISKSKYLIMEIFVTFFLLRCTANIANISFQIWNTDQQILPVFSHSIFLCIFCIFLSTCSFVPITVMYVYVLYCSTCESLCFILAIVCLSFSSSFISSIECI